MVDLTSLSTPASTQSAPCALCQITKSLHMHTGPRGPLLFGWCTHYVPTTSHQPPATFRTAPAPLHTLPHTSVHLHAPPRISTHPCATFCTSLSRASHPYWTFHLTSDPFGYPGQLSPSATGHNAHPQTSVESSPNSAAPIWPICFLCGPAQPT